jgi:hypothetical protein
MFFDGCECTFKFLLMNPSTPVSSTSKTDRHNITEILLKVALNTTTPLFQALVNHPFRVISNSDRGLGEFCLYTYGSGKKEHTAIPYHLGPITRFNLSHVCVYPKPGPGFLSHMLRSFCVHVSYD